MKAGLVEGRLFRFVAPLKILAARSRLRRHSRLPILVEEMVWELRTDQCDAAAAAFQLETRAATLLLHAYWQ